MLCTRCQCEIADNPITINEGILKACEFFKITPDKLISIRRDREVARPRMMLMNYLYTQGHTLKKIASALGNRHHSTVLHARTAINNDIETNPDIAHEYCEFLNYING